MPGFVSPLSKEDINRFSRQLILRGFGVDAQKKLKSGSALIIGAGGLGCPVAIYLAAAGVGKIGIVDHDVISIDNLHRQVGHKEKNVGMNKSISLKSFIESLNPTIEVKAYETLISSKNVKEIMSEYDVIGDCSDNVVTRYLLNDASVLYKKILVSGSALGWEGQLTTYSYDKNCPCYRCLFPVPPPPESVTNCSEGGVLGPIVGVIGSMEALEIIKILSGLKPNFAGKLFLFDGMDGVTRNIKLRGRNNNCVVCGDDPKIKELIDYEVFCSATATDKILSINILGEDERIGVKELASLDEENYVLIDCRSKEEFEICHLTNTFNIPLREIDKITLKDIEQKTNKKPHNIFVICHRGNDSQKAVEKMKSKINDKSIVLKDVIGGYEAWNQLIDNQFPTY
ncbi:Adenylyltransferase and sulfurtransferase MOCS3 [Strongyloides ratti]|uniref:Adenylyltransferase and sulfurtransferase MOCS3 homolog n=1 Tax=Strongyloides ratti TaxID=34506 RepID=A0A090KXK8_STRRB|nr:Adenylyltransferase and sulfurtransferase MOCS3 [Strongyloides ratti]CEF62210.1 Adenylyltransferase and sulfurtransferase MOCS3 [Strongyloides ratti]